MEKKNDEMKMELAGNSSSRPSYPFSGMFDFCENSKDNNSLGFMELLGVQDYLFDFAKIGSSDVANDCYFVNPSTPNCSSSISSASSEAIAAELPDVDSDDDDQPQPPPKKGLKADQEKRRRKKASEEKKPRQPRFAFMTKSEVDHLEDGYRWRKYGQKAVKHSPFPRSYFRCTSASCNVKKRVERCLADPSVVVTTYEGQHTHLCPLMPSPPPQATSSLINTILMPRPLFSHYQGLQKHFGSSFPRNVERRFCSPAGGSSAPMTVDHGLLQDIVPSNMLKQG